eukprot:gene743-359_t
MGKSMKSKYMKRKRMVKRQRAGLLVDTPRLHDNKKKLDLLVQSEEISEKKKKNAFRYPEENDSEFPQHEEVTPLDFRSEALPGMAYAHRHARRKFTDEEKALIAQELRVIPEKEAKRLGLLEGAEHIEVGAAVDVTKLDESEMAENTLAGVVVNGVKRKITKPVLSKT